MLFLRLWQRIFHRKELTYAPMSYPAISEYRKRRESIEKVEHQPTEGNLRSLFSRLLDSYIEGQNLVLVEERTDKKTGKRPDGTLRNHLKLDAGHWESKGPSADLEKEISKKIKDGYPIYNTLFENSEELILYQDRVVRAQAFFDNDEALDECLQLFISYRPKEITRFEEAIEHFKSDLPALLEELRKKIDAERNADFIRWRDELIKHCRTYINPAIEGTDIREMLIQHILTADIFERIFTDADFHREHHLASQMNHLQEALLGGQPRKEYLSDINYYYEALGAAAGYVGESEKQNFLKLLYEEFYKAYNPAAADRLGIVYTPTEIVKFIVRNADSLLKKHFGRGISDEGVNILEPATGTGTFVCELIEQMDIGALSHKYAHELHANEVSLLAYYVANLNITYAYKQKAGSYAGFEGLCFVDTLDLDVSYLGKQGDLLAALSDENVRRVEAQQEKIIHLIIGNPPYNAAQRNENENNKNREYPAVDQRIKSSFIKEGTAQLQAQLYDMYVRFYRWAMDRLKDEGMVAFITNRSFIDARTFDGFRRIVQQSFDHAYIVDLGGDARAKGRAAGGNVFDIKTGVAIMFLIKKQQKDPQQQSCCIHYFAYPDTDDGATKLQKLSKDRWTDLASELIKPDKDANWINQSTSDFDALPIPVANKETKHTKVANERALFKLYSNGVKTNRDSWVYDFNKKNLAKKVNFFIDFYNKEIARWKESDKKIPTNDFVRRDIKWTMELEAYMKKDSTLTYNKQHIVPSTYRPFTKKYTYFGRIITHRPYQNEHIFGFKNKHKNTCICFSVTKRMPFAVIATKAIPNLAMFVEPIQCLPFYRYDADGRRVDNITKWGLEKFQTHYKDRTITREQIFAYTYAVLHAPSYRERYAIDLKRHYPRLPFYDSFVELARLGQQLLDLHTDYEGASSYGLRRMDKQLERPLPRLRRSRPSLDCIEIDDMTSLHDVPDEAWGYILGTRSALEWVLDQYKEKKDELPPIEGLRPYRFADYKEEAIELLQKVCTVSIETMRLVASIDRLTSE